MAAFLEDEGWIRLYYDGDTLDLHCESWDYNEDDPDAFIIDYADRGHVGFTMNSEKVTVKLKNVYVTTEANWIILKRELVRAQEADISTPLKMRIQVNSSPTYELFDGTTGNDIMPVLLTAKKGFTKKFRGNTTFYLIKSLVFRQSGDLE